jgi:hypothetical protein
MNRGLLGTCKVGLVGLVIAASTAVGGLSASAGASENLVVNSGAESGLLTGWTGNGFSVGAYGTPPAPATAQGSVDLGSRVFTGQPGATLTQVVALDALQPNRGAAFRTAWLGAFLSAGSADQPTLTLQWLDGDGVTLGAPTTAWRAGPGAEYTSGPITTSLYLQSFGESGEPGGAIPPAARAARITLTAPATAAIAADDFYLGRVAVYVPPLDSPIDPAPPVPTQPAPLPGRPQIEQVRAPLAKPVIVFGRRSGRVVRRGGRTLAATDVSVSCPRVARRACLVKASARDRRGSSIGRGSLTVAPGRRATVAIRLTKPAIEKLVRGGKLRAMITIAAQLRETDAAPTEARRGVLLTLVRQR